MDYAKEATKEAAKSAAEQVGFRVRNTSYYRTLSDHFWPVRNHVEWNDNFLPSDQVCAHLCFTSLSSTLSRRFAWIVLTLTNLTNFDKFMQKMNQAFFL